MVPIDRIYQLIAEHTSDLVCVHDSENTIRFATRSSIGILGHPSEHLIGKKLTDFLAPNFVGEMDFDTLRKFFDNPGSRIRYQITHGEGRLRWLESTFSRIDGKAEGEFSILSSTRDITESVHLTDDLMSALASEQKFSHFKENLYSVTSHEFKTPLAVIQAHIEMLRVKKDNPKILENSLNIMEGEIDQVNSMIADMLELKKLNTGKVKLKKEKLDLVELIEDYVNHDCKKAYPEIQVKLKTDGEPKELEADYSLLRYVFSNLLTNACKYSDKKPEVEINLHFNERAVHASVKDYGIGILPEDQASIFSSFFRGKNVSNVSGTGIGLSIVKEFVDLHKGNLTFESAPKEGSIFFVELPYSKFL